METLPAYPLRPSFLHQASVMPSFSVPRVYAILLFTHNGFWIESFRKEGRRQEKRGEEKKGERKERILVDVSTFAVC